jgi:hypothetical protein
MRYYACQLSRQGGGGYLHYALPVCYHALLRVTSVLLRVSNTWPGVR